MMIDKPKEKPVNQNEADANKIRLVRLFGDIDSMSNEDSDNLVSVLQSIDIGKLQLRMWQRFQSSKNTYFEIHCNTVVKEQDIDCLIEFLALSKKYLD